MAGVAGVQKKRVVFFGTPEFSVPSLQKLVESNEFDVVLVVSQPDRPAGRKMQLKASHTKEYALSQGLSVATPEKAKEASFLEKLKSVNADLAVVVAYGQILSQSLLDIFSGEVFNLHASLLPHLRGAAPIQRALMNCDSETGVTLQRVVQKLDAGPILGLRRLKIREDHNATILFDELSQIGSELLTDELVRYLEGSLKVQEQDESKVTIAKKIEKDEARILWNQLEAKYVKGLVDGLVVWPKAYFLWKSKPVKILKARLVGGNDAAVFGRTIEAGRVLMSDDGLLIVGCSRNSAIEIVEVLPESRSRMTAKDFIIGFGLNTDDILE
ncbi:MAG: methionyl-tRNA formyltransferase [Bdellovibrionales bacterium CG10_big_fil_rev_8_21_14_0_10_45_34]|nr:MAG: methionyl-tRNA formyltransferase [Bdellovibrionales bacterium CG10_big_fil_rev_8_21_14_0_10_45_34]